jgi:NAD+ synthase
MIMEFNNEVLNINCEAESQRIEQFIREQVFQNFRKKGIIIGLSGGIDSAVVATLSVRAMGAERVIGLILPERESNPISAQYAERLATALGIRWEKVEITPMLESFGVYARREAIVKKYFSEFDPAQWKFRLVMPQNLLDKDRFNVSSLQVSDSNGRVDSKRLAMDDYLAMVAATDIKQRVRMTMLYYFAEKNNYIVAGTTNVPELAQGFFVKYGDGGVDIEPIAHLYKTQVFQLARYLEVPAEIIERTPSPDTYSFVVSDQEIYFCLPYETLDLLLYARANQVPTAQIVAALKLQPEQIERAFRDFDAKEKASAHLRQMPPNLRND